MRPVNRENAVAGELVGDGGGLPAVPGDAALPEAARRPLRELMDDALLDALLERSRDQAGGLRLTGEGSMLGELVRAVLERALEAELGAHLGYGRSERGGAPGGNARNGSIAKTVQTGVGPVPVQVPRDRAGTFEPLLVPKRAGRVAFGHAPVEADHGEVIEHEIACPVQRGDQHSVGPDPVREVSVPRVRQHPACSRPIATSTTARRSAKCERSAASATGATGACPGVVISASL
jgi:hypothetical protein